MVCYDLNTYLGIKKTELTSFGVIAVSLSFFSARFRNSGNIKIQWFLHDLHDTYVEQDLLEFEFEASETIIPNSDPRRVYEHCIP